VYTRSIFGMHEFKQPIKKSHIIDTLFELIRSDKIREHWSCPVDMGTVSVPKLKLLSSLVCILLVCISVTGGIKQTE